MKRASTKHVRKNRSTNEEEFIRLLQKEYKNYSNWIELVQNVASISQGIALSNEAKVKFYYRLGVILRSLNQNEKRTLLNTFNISGRMAKFFILLVERFPTEEDALDFLYHQCEGKITTLFKSLRNRSKPARNISLTFADVTKKVIGSFYNLTEHDKNIIAQAIEKLSKWFPLKTYLDDRNFLRYSRCSCCGRDENVTPLILQKYPDNPVLEYPICQECLDSGAEIDFKILAEIWGLYAYNIEAIFDKIHYGENL